MENRKIVVVGGGPGGLTAAMLLAKRGFDVTVYEKRHEVGGRSGRIVRSGYTFDVGSTLLMMKFVLDEMFNLAGRKADDLLDFVRVDPMYRLDFDERAIHFWADPAKTRAEIAEVYPGNEDGVERMLKKEHRRFELLYGILQGHYNSLWSCALSGKVLRGLPRFGLGKSMYDVMGSYFSAEDLRIAFTFQSQYLGMSPWECPGGFAIVPYVEHGYGIYYVMGGINRITQVMADVVAEEGGTVHTGTAVTRLVTEGRTVTGVELEGGDVVEADDVVLNADFAWAMNELVDDGVLRKWTPERLAKKRYSNSTFMLYLGLDTIYEDQPHHNFVFAHDVRRNMDDIVRASHLPEDFSFYLCNPSVTDPSLAPAGHSALYVLVPVPHLGADVNWDQEGPAFRERVLDAIESRTRLTDLRSHIREEVVLTPEDWRRELNVYRGAIFNLAHVLSQLLCFRPHNRFEDLDRCFIVGGGTNPGSGMPTVYESGRIAADLICEKYGLETKPPAPLPH